MTTPDQPCHLAGMHPTDCPAYVAGIATLRERLTAAPIRLTRSPADERDSLARRLSVRFAEAEELRAQMAQLRDERDAAYERGVAEGRRQAVTALALQLGHDLVTDVAEADLEPWFRAALQTANEQGRRQATEGWDREWGLAMHGHPGQCVLNEHAARGIAADPTAPADTKVLSRLVGPWEPAEQAQDGAR